MPSKSKKQSKTPSRQSNSDLSASPRTPSVTSLDSEVNEEDLRCSLDEVSRQYPSLIGKSAFIGRVNHVDSETRSCKIWLSESSMVSSYLAPGSLVSVSLAALKNQSSNGFPLSSVRDEYAQPFGVVDQASETAKEVGNYFALATVFPSCKVLKNGVRLSASLSYTLGSPSSGSIVFVYPIQSEFQTGLTNGSEKGPNLNANCLSLNSCQQLHLQLTSKNTVKTNFDIQSKMESSTGKTHDRFENGITSSPKTPLYQQKLSSLHSAQLDSPFCEGSASNISKPNGLSVNSFDIEEILRDESSKKLLETCATSWLHSRNLLRGNIVAIPILSELCIFRVIGAGISNRDLRNGSRHCLPPLTLAPMEHVNSAFVVDHKTKVYLRSSSDLSFETQPERPSPCVQHDLGDVQTIMEHDIPELGGLSKEYATLKEIISSVVKNSLSSFGLQTTKGVLLHGPSGTGKTSLARLCVHDASVNLFCVNGPEIVSEYHGESEQELHKVFESALQAAPSVVFIDELDAIAPARKEGGEQLSLRMVATLLNLMDGISTTEGVLVLAATNRPDSIEPALRRPGRFDRELEIGVPSPKQRLDILRTLLRKMDHCISDMQVQHLATATHGFVGADLASLCNEAALVCLRRYCKFKVSCHGLESCGMPNTHVGQSGTNMEGMECGSDLSDISSSCLDSASFCKLPDSAEVSQTTASIHNGINNISEGMSLVKENCLLRLAFEDFEKARMKVRPSAMREIILEVPKVNWEDVGGQREVKMQLMEAVEWPQKHQDAFKRIGTRPPTGVLMFGPPGCSKTLMARAVASEAGLNFLAVKGPELFSKWVGESEKAVRSLFAKARANAPSIIFFDEIDSLAVIRGKDTDGVSVSDRVMSQLLVELDGLHQRVDVTVIATTNRPDKIDPALLRPGRFDRLLYVGPPNENDREEIFGVHLRKIPCSPDVSLKELVHLTEGCTGADISLICREAAVIALEESLDAEEVTMHHLKAAIRLARPSEIQSYQELSAKFERLVHSSSVEKKLGSPQCSTRSTEFSFWQTVVKTISQLFGGFANTKQPS